MGLFGRSRAEREQIDRLRHELTAVQERLRESVRANVELDDRLRNLDTTNDRLTSEVAALRTSNAELTGRLAAVDDLSAHVDDLSARLIPAPTEPPPPPVGGGDDAGAGGAARADLDELQRRVTTLSESMVAMDDRVSNISTELANQLTELGAELDAVSRRSETGAAIDDDELVAHVERAVEQAMDEIQGGQERLAAEQARYQIQFRQDLAELADRLRRSRDTR